MKKFYYFILIISFTFFISCTDETASGINATLKDDSVSTNDCKPYLSPKKYAKIKDSIFADSKSQAIQHRIDSIQHLKKLNGLLYIQQKGIVITKFIQGSTCMNCEKSEIINENTLFQLASLSKTFTAVATLQLIEQKKLNLDDSVEKFFPEFPYKNIKIKSLLSHRSGLPNYMYAFDDSMRRNVTKPDNQKIIQWLINVKPDPYNRPNKSFCYNNSNYAVLAAIIEQISGLSFTEYLNQKIFKPLGMNNTYLINNLPQNTNITKGYERTRLIPKDFYDDVLGDKGIYSCLNDLIIWYNALNGTCLLKRETLEMAFLPQSFEYPGRKNYGLGFRLWLDKDQKNVKYIYHNGWWKGYNTLFWFSPKSKTLIISLTNIKNKSIYYIKPYIEILEPEEKNNKDEDSDSDE
ncbi:MAG: serine hydrolase domain-containing protein [Cytophagales bacterium]